MKNKENGKRKRSGLKNIILILSALFVLCAGGLFARIIHLNYFKPVQASTVITDNFISEKNYSAVRSEDFGKKIKLTSASKVSSIKLRLLTLSNTSGQNIPEKSEETRLELYKGNPDYSEKIEFLNMFPGDSVTEKFCIKVYHEGDVDLIFNAEVTEEVKALGDVLNIKVTHLETGNILCNAPFSQIKGEDFSEKLKKAAEGETTANYQIEVSMATSVGNEYQASKLNTDLSWRVEGSLAPPPKTGDNTKLIVWIILLLSASLLIILLFMFMKRRKGDKRHE